MGLEQLKSNFPTGEALGEQIAKSIKISQRLAHLLAVNQEVGAVKPILDEMLAGKLQSSALALSDFVLVMREDEILATEMEIEAGAEKFDTHRAAFDVPA